jgi:hypothetical protein
LYVLHLSPAEQLYDQLLEIHALLVRVGNMSTLVALIKAASVRDDFQRTNRDLINTFNILAQGEQLLVSRRWFAAVLQGLIACKGRDWKDGWGWPRHGVWAEAVCDTFQRTSRGLINTFNILAQGAWPSCWCVAGCAAGAFVKCVLAFSTGK